MAACVALDRWIAAFGRSDMTTAHCDLTKTFVRLDALPPGADPTDAAACCDVQEFEALGRLRVSSPTVWPTAISCSSTRPTR
jgi:hypothetical protein